MHPPIKMMRPKVKAQSPGETGRIVGALDDDPDDLLAAADPLLSLVTFEWSNETVTEKFAALLDGASCS